MKKGRGIKGEGVIKHSSQSGYILIWSIILIAFASMVTFALLEYSSAAFRRQGSFYDLLLERQAAEAGLKRVVADLVRGTDAIDTTYVGVQPHTGGQPYSTFTFTTSYTVPSVTVNYLTPTITISTPSSSVMPSGQQQYIDPGVIDPDFATLPPGNGYLMWLFQVKAGTIVLNWAYSPAGTSRIGVWEGIPVNNQTQQPIPPGRVTSWPQETPILDTGFSPGNAVFNRSTPVAVSGTGIYTVIFYNSSGNTTKTTAAFAPSGGQTDTWVYIKSYRDYLVTVSVNNTTINAYLRQIPGYSRPPNTGWGASNVSWITNSVYTRSFDRP